MRVAEPSLTALVGELAMRRADVIRAWSLHVVYFVLGQQGDYPPLRTIDQHSQVLEYLLYSTHVIIVRPPRFEWHRRSDDAYLAHYARRGTAWK